MNSIKRKLFFQIGSLVIFIVCLMLLANSLLLESYYTYKQKNKLIDYYNTINSMDSDSYDDNLEQFLLIENTSNVDIVLLSNSKDIIYASKSYMNDKKMLDQFINFAPLNTEKTTEEIIPPIVGQPPTSVGTTKVEIINDKISFIWANDHVFKNQILMLSGTLDNGNYIELKIHIESIKTNIKLSNDFLIIIGIISFIIAMLFAYIISKYFTKPITEMNYATNRLKNLDFDCPCEVTSNDEIGQLAQSINEMSTELSATINTLSDKNIQLQNEIKEKNKLDEKRRTLLNNVSHELKTPLSLMQGYAEGLKLNIGKNKEKSDFYCDVIIDESTKMSKLVESLLNIDQMEFGDITLQKTVFEINQLILSIVNKYERVFENKNIKFNIATIDPIEVMGDNFMLERVFENYLTNAISYVDENLQINVQLINLKEHIRIEVFNTSPAISEQDLDKIWNEFYKLDKARTREKGGHGLGLSIVSAIQKAHKNSYGVENVENGVCFWFEIDVNI
jgi:signal transduction histidine kinase